MNGMIQTLMAPEQRLTLTNISWEHYETLLNLLGDRPLRFTYSHGTLELMILSFQHERYKKLLARLVETLAEEWDIPLVGGGSATCKRQDLERGLEPDECFYSQNAAAIQGKQRLDLRHDPPPDLALEIDITHRTLDRRTIYAALGVGEVWEFDGQTLQFWQLVQGQYQEITTSHTFPRLTPDHLLPWILKAETLNDTALIRAFRQSLRSGTWESG